MRLPVVVLVILGLASLVSSSLRGPPAASVMFPVGHGIVKTRLMVMILSYAGDDRRNSLRETWLQDPTNRTQSVFVVGNIDKSSHREKVLKEQEMYGDIIVLNDVIDDYYHLSDKVLRGFQEVHERYVFDYVLKADTDTFVVLPRLLEFLEGIAPVRKYIGSFATTKSASELWFGHFKVIYYMLGGGYILSKDLIAYFAHSQHLMLRTPSEDVTVGIHLHSIVTHYDSLDETQFHATASQACVCISSLMLNHKCKKSDMYYMHHSFETTGDQCYYQKDHVFKSNIAKEHKIPAEEAMMMRW